MPAAPPMPARSSATAGPTCGSPPSQPASWVPRMCTNGIPSPTSPRSIRTTSLTSPAVSSTKTTNRRLTRLGRALAYPATRGPWWTFLAFFRPEAPGPTARSHRRGGVMRTGLWLGRRLVPLLCILLPSVMTAQGVTRSGIHGLILDSEDNPLTSVSVVAVHLPSGTQYRAVSRAGGAYNLPNMRVGGPYRIRVTFIGFRPDTLTELSLDLGINQRLDFPLPPPAVQLGSE